MGKLIAYNDFQGGLNDTSAPDDLKDNELSVAENIDLSERGGFNTRKGVEKINATSYGYEVTQEFEWLVTNISRRIAVINKKLCLIGEDGSIQKEFQVASDKVAYIVSRNRLYFIDGAEIYSWGEFDYFTSKGTTSIKKDDIVQNSPKSTGGGTEGNFYRALVDQSSVDLKTANYADTSKWEDVTDVNEVISNVIRPVKANTDAINNLKPIKKCTMIVQHPVSLRYFAAGNPDDPLALYYSEYNDISYWKETSKVYPVYSEGSITGITVIVESVLVSYNNSWYHWTGIDPTQDALWKPLPIPFGTVSNDSIVLTPFSFTFLSRIGIHMVSASILSQDFVMIQGERILNNITENKVENTIRNIVHPETACAVFHDNKYILAYGDDKDNPKNNKVLVYDLGVGGFVKYTGWQVNSWSKKSNGELIFASKNFILRTGIGNSDIDVETGESKPIHLYVETKNYNLGLKVNTKYIQFMYLLFKQYEELESSVNITVIADYKRKIFNDVNLAESLIWGRPWGAIWGYNDLIEKYAELKNLANRVKVVFEDESLNNHIGVYGVGFEFKPLRPRANLIEGEGRLINEAY